TGTDHEHPGGQGAAKPAVWAQPVDGTCGGLHARRHAQHSGGGEGLSRVDSAGFG
ncbi:unnamed protein product, partial [Effrenium voratum]